MPNKNFTTTILVDRTPREVFDAINNVRGWWSEAIEGDTDKPGAEFNYHYKDVHRCKFKITELVPGRKVAWHVVDNYFNFTKDKSEWKGTNVVFEINGKGSKTEVRFTHVGLVPSYECYNVCSEAWGEYITGSLHDLITKGKGNPNPIEEVVNKAREMSNKNFTASFTVDQSPEEVFAAVNNVRGWWSGEINGETNKSGDEFTYRVQDIHYSKQKITEFIPGKKVVWHVLDASLSFVKDKSEWKGTDIVFEIDRKGDKTEVCFTHKGLVSNSQCYNECSNAWGLLVNGNLFKLITTGKAQPSPW
ncbi:MAG: SRPBCC domain-containing protein [Bacteroidota bacterium]